EKNHIIPPSRVRYLSEITENNRGYDRWVNQQREIAQQLYGVHKAMEALQSSPTPEKDIVLSGLEKLYAQIELELDPKHKKKIEEWAGKVLSYSNGQYLRKVRDKEITVKTSSESISHARIPKIALPKYQGWGGLLKWVLTEN